LTSEAQVRIFSAGAGSGTRKGTMRACEISRKLFLQDADSGGWVVEEENTPAYLSDGGSYGFAEGHFMPGQPMSEPIEVKLRTRCAVCHGENLAQIRTFSVVRPPNPPEIRQLNPASNVVAEIDISIKRKKKDLQALLEYFKGTHP
jgi:hypothetical protein